LCDVGFLDRDAQGKVGIGMRMWELAARSNPLEEFRQRGRPVLEGIQEALRHDVSLSVPTYEDFTVLYVERFDTHGTVNNNLANVAWRLDMLCTSAGLAMLANAEHHVLEQFLTGPIPQCTPRTITCPEQLRAQFAEIRERGFSRLAGDLVAENVGFSVPVNGQANKVIGAITVGWDRPVDNPLLIVAVLAAAGSYWSRMMGYGRPPYL